MAETPESLQVFHDGGCPLCVIEIAHYQRLARSRALTTSLGFTDVSRPGLSLPDGLDRGAALARFHVMRHDGTLRSGAEAFVELWRYLPGWRWLARLAALPGGLILLEGGYRLFLKLRPAMVWGLLSLRHLRRRLGRKFGRGAS